LREFLRSAAPAWAGPTGKELGLAVLNRIAPELQKLIVPKLDRAFTDVRRELTPEIEEIVRAGFGRAMSAGR